MAARVGQRLKATSSFLSILDPLFFYSSEEETQTRGKAVEKPFSKMGLSLMTTRGLGVLSTIVGLGLVE
ncbi:unnamed protein product [Linum trigynum]|uniref:Uncharacterized protein n=1 Tax=Linum trigynum TaxID=586398 RepID=A0AAV2GCK5_9ROSI